MLGARPGLVAGLLVNLGLRISPTHLSFAPVFLFCFSKINAEHAHISSEHLRWPTQFGLQQSNLDNLSALRVAFLALRLQRRGSQIWNLRPSGRGFLSGNFSWREQYPAFGGQVRS